MSLCICLVSATLTMPSPLTCPERPQVEVVHLYGKYYKVRSAYPIRDVYLKDPLGRYSFYVDYSADYRCAVVEIKTAWTPFSLVVETGIVGARALRKKHDFTFPNPARRRRCR